MTFLTRVLSKPPEVAGARRYRATWNGAVLAESADTIVVEGNHYFPPADVGTEHLQPSESHTTCHWKGVASYHDVVVGKRSIGMPPGTIRIPVLPPNASEAESRSGMASRWNWRANNQRTSMPQVFQLETDASARECSSCRFPRLTLASLTIPRRLTVGREVDLSWQREAGCSADGFLTVVVRPFQGTISNTKCRRRCETAAKAVGGSTPSAKRSPDFCVPTNRPSFTAEACRRPEPNHVAWTGQVPLRRVRVLPGTAAVRKTAKPRARGLAGFCSRYEVAMKTVSPLTDLLKLIRSLTLSRIPSWAPVGGLPRRQVSSRTPSAWTVADGLLAGWATRCTAIAARPPQRELGSPKPSQP